MKLGPPRLVDQVLLGVGTKLLLGVGYINIFLGYPSPWGRQMIIETKARASFALIDWTHIYHLIIHLTKILTLTKYL